MKKFVFGMARPAIPVACLMIACSSVPALAAPQQFDSLADDGIVEPFKEGAAKDSVKDARDWFPGNRSTVVNVPGTGDKTFAKRTAPINGDRDAYELVYPGSIGPITTGNRGDIHSVIPFFAPSYDESVQQGSDAVLRSFEEVRGPSGTDEPVIWSAFSLGSRALGDGVERASAKGLVTDRDNVILMADPRGPWGMEQEIYGKKSAERLSKIDANVDGARNPADSGKAKVVSVVHSSDPVANTQWDNDRFAESLVLSLTGHVLVHAGLSDQNYDHALDAETLDRARFYRSEDGNTVYAVIDNPHPYALARKTAYDAVGARYTQEELDSWNAQANARYRVEPATAENAAIPVHEISREEFERQLPDGYRG